MVNVMDIFEKAIKKQVKLKYLNMALRDKSYVTKYYEVYKKPLLMPTNKKLSTYGDCILNWACVILFIKLNKCGAEIAKYRSNKFLVEVVAKYYDLDKYILKIDKKEANNYIYIEKKNKYLADAIEAIIAVIFINHKNINEVVELLNFWVNNHKNT